VALRRRLPEAPRRAQKKVPISTQRSPKEGSKTLPKAPIGTSQRNAPRGSQEEGSQRLPEAPRGRRAEVPKGAQRLPEEGSQTLPKAPRERFSAASRGSRRKSPIDS